MSEAGVAQLVELQPSKLNVASSSLVSRSKLVSVQIVDGDKLNLQKTGPLTVDAMVRYPPT